MPEYREVQLREDEQQPVPIVATGTVANKELSGSMQISAMVLDTSDRPDLDELLEKHMLGADGEVLSQWIMELGRSGELMLMLQFQQPSVAGVLLAFDVDLQGCLLDQVMRTGAMFLFKGRRGDKLSQVVAKRNPGILIQVTTIAHDWQAIWTDVICCKYGCPPDSAHRMQEEWRRRGAPTTSSPNQ